MKLGLSKSKHSTSLYVMKSFRKPDGKVSTKVVEKLGTLTELQEKLGEGIDPMVWAKEYIKTLNKQEKEEGALSTIQFYPLKQLPLDVDLTFNSGYLFLQSIYHQLGLDEISKEINKKYKHEFDLNMILSRLIYTRLLFPSSKRSTFINAKRFIEQPTFELHHLYRALEVIAKESDFIEAKVYENSKQCLPRNSTILYYDCTNFYFEIEEANGIKQYGKSKENRPNPIVQMGLFIDGNGIPLAFSLQPGNQNEQGSLQPIEKRVMKDFKLSKVVVCTDAGLSSSANRKFNNTNNKRFITTQSIKKLKAHLKEWALDPHGWRLPNSTKTIHLDDVVREDAIYYKERWIHEDGLEQRLVVSFSLKYKHYSSTIRNRQIERAQKLIEKKKPNTPNATSPKRFIQESHITKDGEVANDSIFDLDINKIIDEEKYDGFYAVCSNLEDDIETILLANKNRWEIEESFRILKKELKARPVYLTREDRIKAHFTTCFLSLLVYRILEKQLSDRYTVEELLTTLKHMNVFSPKGDEYLPSYTRTQITDDLHHVYGFRTDYQIIHKKNMRKIIKSSKAKTLLQIK